jgi:hypothetical protein
MKPIMYEHPKNENNNTGKKLFILTMILAGSLIATTGYSQVYVNARVGFGFPVRRVYARAVVPPAVVYQEGYAPAPVYQEGYAADPLVYENEFPGYAYYNYPVWNGHYRDRLYYEHYRPYFERENGAYFNHGRFERERFENERNRQVHSNREFTNRGYGDRGHNDRGSDHHRGR